MNKTIRLSTPINVAGTLSDTLSLREPLVADLLKAKKSSKSPEEMQVALLADLLQITPQEVGQLSLRDYNAVGTAFEELTKGEGGGFLPSSETSS